MDSSLRRGASRAALWIGLALLAAPPAAALLAPGPEFKHGSPAAPAREQHAARGLVVGGRGSGWPGWGLALPAAGVPVAQDLRLDGGDAPGPALDRRVRAVRAAGGAPVVTLRPGPRAAALPDLAARVARRYPEVRHYVVGEDTGALDAAAYTALYNKVYAALKGVDPRLRVGGPAVAMADRPPGGAATDVGGAWGGVDQRALDAVRYWLGHKAGADFVAVDGPPPGPGDPFAALGRYSAVTQWLSAQSDGELPVWWTGWSAPPGAAARSGAVQAAALIRFVRGGATSALYRPPGGRTSARDLAVLRAFGRWFPPGTPLRRAASSDPAVLVLAQPRATVAVNTAPRAAVSVVDGERLALRPYEVRWITG
ncbi:hypothetical protein [Actinomadura atramentaria]|uniref:hypothetical protein n=1 Tax=Actinomadura atramentaria TaxID=1990 RepID=UPI00037A0C95|nr:hypothetical protein [Actinomadura atramentaria]